jgi:hypothetical protein
MELQHRQIVMPFLFTLSFILQFLFPSLMFPFLLPFPPQLQTAVFDVTYATFEVRIPPLLAVLTLKNLN